MGRLSMLRWSTVSVVEVRVVSMRAASDVTVIDVCPPLTTSATGNSADSPTVTVTSLTSALAKPDDSTVTM